MNTCIYCGESAVRFCDCVIGFADPDGDGLCALDPGHRIERCDAGLCLDHAAFKGNLFVCGKRGFHDSIDWCFTHEDEDWRPLAEGEAEQIRYRHRCAAGPGLRLVSAVEQQEARE